MEEKQTIVVLGTGRIAKKVRRKLPEDGSEGILIEWCENVKEVDLYIEKNNEMIERNRRLLEDVQLFLAALKVQEMV